MKKNIPFFMLIFWLTCSPGFAQILTDSTSAKTFSRNINNGELKGLVLDRDTKEPLAYTSIFVLEKHAGTITNETGHFSLDLSGLDETDTLRFQYIGYEVRNLTIGQLDTMQVVYLKEDIFNLNEIVVFGSAPDPKSIVKKVLENKEKNYPRKLWQWETFIRERYTNDLDDIKIDYKKSSILDLNRDIIAMFEEKAPRHTTSYTDFLGNIYLPENKDDTIKIDPVRTVELKEENIAELEQLAEIFSKVLSETGEDEYWKIKSGIFGQKLDLDEEDSIPPKDSVGENKRRLKYFTARTTYNLSYSLLENKDDWEFLYNTGRYSYTLAGGTRVNGEDVYIIDFEPGSRGRYTGRLYISVTSFALIRADYEYAPDKTGTDFHLLGVGYTENEFNGSIYFEKKGDAYVLKYFSRKVGSTAGFDRKLALLKIRKRFLFDKKLNELKIRLDLAVTSESLVEVLVLDQNAISLEQFTDFKPEKYMDVIFVDQFDDELWKGYSIIEPTKKMRDYKKHGDADGGMK